MQRHYCMSQIKSKNTRPEILVRKFLFSRGFRYRINVKSLPGKPDIVLAKYKTVIFVNGCFWHGHEGCINFRMPKSNVAFWHTKIQRNKERDLKESAELISQGWNVIRLWECQLAPLSRNSTLSSLEYLLNKWFLDSFPSQQDLPRHYVNDIDSHLEKISGKDVTNNQLEN